MIFSDNISQKHYHKHIISNSQLHVLAREGSTTMCCMCILWLTRWSYACDNALSTNFDIIIINPAIWEILSTKYHMIIFFISKLPINWSHPNALIPIDTSLTILLLNSKSIASMLRELFHLNIQHINTIYAISNNRFM